MRLIGIANENGAIWRRFERQTAVVEEQFERGKGLHIAAHRRRQFLPDKLRGEENLLLALLGELVQSAGQSLCRYLERMDTRLLAVRMRGVQEKD